LTAVEAIMNAAWTNAACMNAAWMNGACMNTAWTNTACMNTVWVRRGATALAAARTALGVVALTSPALPGRPWVGAAADATPGRVLARALGGRDLALGLGALAALQPFSKPSAGAAANEAALWVGMGALADSVDLLATAIAWRELPPVGRWLVAASAGGAALAGAAAAWALIAEEGHPSAALPQAA
jgi:hypothetical protein